MSAQPQMLFDLLNPPADPEPLWTPTARRTDPVTSHAAARLARSKSDIHRDLARVALRQAGARGLTDFELSDVTGVPQTSIGVRRHDLVKLGEVEDSGETRMSPSNSPAIVWRVR